jgi:hypothetical protein
MNLLKEFISNQLTIFYNPFYLDFLVKIVLIFEEEFVERQEQKSNQNLILSNYIKDGIR